MSEYLYTWEFDDKKTRWSLWYIIALSFVIWFSIWWFFTKQYWMSFIILLLAGLVYFVDNNSSDSVEVKISNIWVNIAWVLYDYKNIKSFWIVYKWDEPLFLRLFLNRKWLKNIDVQINNNIIENVKNALTNNVLESEKIDLSPVEKIILLLKL